MNPIELLKVISVVILAYGFLRVLLGRIGEAK